LIIEGKVSTQELDQINPAPSRVIAIDYDRPQCPFHAEFIQKPYRPCAVADRLSCQHERGKVPDDDQDESNHASSPSVIQRSGPRSERILVAEDNTLNQKILRKLLEKQGWTKITFVANGLDAVKAVQEHAQAASPFDIVLMDIMMPVMSGVEASKQIRELPLPSQPRIVALTANASEEQRVECDRAGMDNYLTKPIKPQELHAALLAR